MPPLPPVPTATPAIRLLAAAGLPLALTLACADAPDPIRDPGVVPEPAGRDGQLADRDTLRGVDTTAAPVASPAPRAGPGAPAPSLPPLALIDRDPAAYLRALRLEVPVAGVTRDALPPSNFDQARGTRTHEAYDIMAPRGTPVLAAAGGHVEKLHVSEAGGNMVYTVDHSGRFVIFYAHLDRYHSSLEEGMPIARGDTLGYVGSTGNAPPHAPHLHFAIMLMDEDRRWWKGTPIDPRPLLAFD